MSDTQDPKKDRKEYMSKYYVENKKEISERRKAKRLAVRDEVNAEMREEYATDPTVREQRLRINAKGRKTYKERIETDLEAKKQHEERLKTRRQRHLERLATDPVYRQQREDFKAALREKRRKQKEKGDLPE